MLGLFFFFLLKNYSKLNFKYLAIKRQYLKKLVVAAADWLIVILELAITICFSFHNRKICQMNRKKA